MDFVTITVSLFIGVGLGYFFSTYRVAPLEKTIASLELTIEAARKIIARERDLNDGLAEELAVQAKLIK